jgi:predicted nucleotidyltransferase
MFLDRILGSKTRVDILAFLTANSTQSFVERELALRTNHSFSEVNRQVGALVESGLAQMQKVGKSKNYSINKNHFLYKPLSRLFLDLNKVLETAAKKTTKFLLKRHEKSVFCVLLVGSVASGTARQDIISNPSDIDIIIVFKNSSFQNAKKEIIHFASNELLNSFGVLARPLFFSLKDFQKGLKEGNPFILNALNKGVLLHGRKPRQFS